MSPKNSISLSRRHFLKLAAAAVIPPILVQTSGGPTDWSRETDLARSVREFLEGVFTGRTMALDFRRINAQYDQEFQIQINSERWFPVASCFKAWVALYYYLNTPRDQWQDTQGTALHSTVVFSSNIDAGIVLADVSRRTSGQGNPIEKFNDFLRLNVGMTNGLYSWDWPGSPTIGFTDQRFLPSEFRNVLYKEELYRIANIFTVTDLAHGYDVLLRGQAFARWPEMQQALAASDALLRIAAANYQSPIEYVFPQGYMGKDGILPEADLPTGMGRIVNDAGVITVGDAYYIIALMSIGESETTVRDVLVNISRMIDVYERGRRLMGTPTPSPSPTSSP